LTTFNDQVFASPTHAIDPHARIIFVADMFSSDYVGGAELTTDALIDESPARVQRIHSHKVNLAALNAGADKIWIFGNFSSLAPELIPSIVSNLKYFVLEYDYKFCRFRSPEKHEASTGKPCDCHEQMNGKMISAFYYGARGLFWMSQNQKERYLSRFPFLAEKDNVVLSSVFSKKTLGVIKQLRERRLEKKGWIVLGSDSWVKGAASAQKWCEDNGKEYEVLWNISYDAMLAKMAAAEGFVYLPAGADTCPRMVIEAKLLGCNLVLNDNVQHKDEEWFDTEDLSSIEDYLFTAPGLFWKTVMKLGEKKPTISGYTTTYNCVSAGYPFEESIRSMLQFCDEVCVVDGGSNDGTQHRLSKLADEVNGETERLKVKIVPIDLNAFDWAYQSDGMQKARARNMCTMDFCWQMDVDEVVHEKDAPKIAELCSKIPKGVDILSLPVIEYWGGPDKVRVDVQPWKWRLSRNLPHITHGIPIELIRTALTGVYLYAAPGTDGCDMIHRETRERLGHMSFHTQESERVRQAAAVGHPEALKMYEAWFNEVTNALPGVHHYSWYDLPRKIRHYRSYWSKFWCSLYNQTYEDTGENNVMFDVPWSQVTDDMIESRAAEFKSVLGGWIWHRKWDGKTRTPHITINRTEPASMRK
jgi:glycosyltransferase involved in cell wall biosynthesis